MVLEMKVPSPGESITEVEIATWLVKDGDYVKKNQAIAEVDSDKATLELPHKTLTPLLKQLLLLLRLKLLLQHLHP